jgi:hypothetical protein
MVEGKEHHVHSNPPAPSAMQKPLQHLVTPSTHGVPVGSQTHVPFVEHRPSQHSALLVHVAPRAKQAQTPERQMVLQQSLLVTHCTPLKRQQLFSPGLNPSPRQPPVLLKKLQHCVSRVQRRGVTRQGWQSPFSQ